MSAVTNGVLNGHLTNGNGHVNSDVVIAEYLERAQRCTAQALRCLDMGALLDADAWLVDALAHVQHIRSERERARLAAYR